MTSSSSRSGSKSGSRPHHRRAPRKRVWNNGFFVVVRALVLGLALAWAIILYGWNREGNPRFYRFIRTAPGRMVARIFRWHAPQPQGAMEDKTDEQMTEKERAVKRSIMESLRAGAPTHRLQLTNGQVMRGKLIEEKPDYVKFSETYGESGSLAMNVSRKRIRGIEPETNPLPRVTYRDVRFQMEFPRFQIYREPPYTILTDELYVRVESSVAVLKTLHEEFLATFGDLVTRATVRDGIQVLFFSREREYQAYQAKYAPFMDETSGFYSPWVDRLVVFNQSSSEHLRRLERRLAAAEDAQRSSGAPPDVLADVEVWRVEMQRDIARFAELETQKVLRHEGAHQLFQTYGVHSENHMESEWLLEGLATFCETPQPGDADAFRIAVLRRAQEIGKLIPLAEIVNLRDKEGLLALGSHARVQVGYAQAWALVRMLMQPEYRGPFFGYICLVRDAAHFREVRRTPSMELLCRFLEVAPEELTDRYLAYVREL
jgi:hypothetical protein